MSEMNFDEELDRALQRRAQSEAPESFIQRVEETLARERTRTRHRILLAFAMAACLLLGVFLVYHVQPHKEGPDQVTARTLPTSRLAATRAHDLDATTVALVPTRSPRLQPRNRRAQRNADLGAKLSETTSPGDETFGLGMVLDTPPRYLPIAKQTAACAMIPCSCPEMCRVSNN